jgi:hypothetical protein
LGPSREGQDGRSGDQWTVSEVPSIDDEFDQIPARVPVRILSESSGIRLAKPEKLLIFSGQKRWIFVVGIGSPGKVGNNGIQVFSLCDLPTGWSDFATTLPELYVTMCSNR